MLTLSRRNSWISLITTPNQRVKEKLKLIFFTIVFHQVGKCIFQIGSHLTELIALLCKCKKRGL
ncbi:Uncharacterised protein [Klebsiella pneumoniae]|nr:Uncharacterised protein [Klebsiella pneumoniae]SWJ44386.1 Uncharacterised protein [Klebsiella pneumoniae]